MIVIFIRAFLFIFVGTILFVRIFRLIMGKNGSVESEEYSSIEDEDIDYPVDIAHESSSPRINKETLIERRTRLFYKQSCRDSSFRKILFSKYNDVFREYDKQEEYKSEYYASINNASTLDDLLSIAKQYSHKNLHFEGEKAINESQRYNNQFCKEYSNKFYLLFCGEQSTLLKSIDSGEDYDLLLVKYSTLQKTLEDSKAYLESDVLNRAKEYLKIINSKLKVKSHYYGRTITNLNELTGEEFEEYCVWLLQSNGYTDIDYVGGPNDKGVDILATKDNKRYAFQCKKRTHNNVGRSALQEVNYAKDYYNADFAVVMTNHQFANKIMREAKAMGIILWDGDYLNDMNTINILE